LDGNFDLQKSEIVEPSGLLEEIERAKQQQMGE
jgi:hypothetical protein